MDSEPRYTITQKYENGSTMTLSEPITAASIKEVIGKLLLNDNINSININKVNNDYYDNICIDFLIDQWTREDLLFSAMVSDNVTNEQLWPFPKINLEKLPENALNKYNNEEYDIFIKWLWNKVLNVKQKKHIFDIRDLL